MMINEKDRFDAILREQNYKPIWPNVVQFMNEDQCLQYVGKIDGWLAGDDQITRKVLESNKGRLKVISKWGTGIDSIDLNAASEMGIPVTNSPGAFGDAVSEYAMGLLISATRKITQTHIDVTNGFWPKYRGIGLRNKTMGIIGYGAIGKSLANKAKGFDMEIIAYDPAISSIETNGIQFVDLIKKSDVIVLCCNTTPENYHMLDFAQFEMMKAGVIIINVARGGLLKKFGLRHLMFLKQNPLPIIKNI